MIPNMITLVSSSSPTPLEVVLLILLPGAILLIAVYYVFVYL
jgi:hypothetical protein